MTATVNHKVKARIEELQKILRGEYSTEVKERAIDYLHGLREVKSFLNLGEEGKILWNMAEFDKYYIYCDVYYSELCPVKIIEKDGKRYIAFYMSSLKTVLKGKKK